MIEEDYVSFEVAKLLKEKGFPQSTFRFHYIIEGNSYYKSFENRCGFGDYDIIAPTLAIAMKWLREVYNLHIWVEPNHDKEGLYNAHVKVGWWSNNWAGVGYNTYEKATEEAIKYCLEYLI